MLEDPKKAAVTWNNADAPLWSGWKDGWLDEVAGNVPAKPGAYILGLAHGPKRSVVIPRLLGKDRHGVLDIGESKNLKTRVQALSRCINRAGATGHMAGWRYSYLELREHLGGRPYLAWTARQNCYELEGEVLHAYLSAFRELPPLNYKFNWSRM